MVQFDPPLSSALTVVVPPTLLLGSRLRLHATLSRDEHTTLRQDGITVQVWSDFGTGVWSEALFTEGAVADGEAETAADVSLIEHNDTEISGDMVTLVADTPLPPLIGRTMQFTYRMAHPSGAVTWLGSMGSNGSISIEPSDGSELRSNDWHEDTYGIFSLIAPVGSSTVVAAKCSQDADWKGWAIGKEGPSSFTAVSSAVTDRVALALLPTPRPDAYVVYAPLLFYTTGDATLSLTDRGEVLFQPGDGEAVIHASVATEAWTNAISEKATVLNLRSPHFLGVSVRQYASMRSIHVLPVSGSKGSVTLQSADLNFPSEAFAMLDPASGAAKFFAASASDEVRVAVGPSGGHILAVSAYTLHREGRKWVIACLPRKARNTKHLSLSEETSRSKMADPISEPADTKVWPESKPEPPVNAPLERHTSDTFEIKAFLIVLHLLRFLLGLVSTSISRSSAFPQQLTDEHIHKQPPVKLSPPTTRISFEVTGNFALVMKGDASQLVFSVGGQPLQSTPKDLGGVWLLESDVGDDPQVLEVSFRDS